MAGSVAEAIAQIMSVQAGELASLATKVRGAGTESATGGRTLSSSAQEVGAQTGDPYAAYRDRLAPVADWMTRFEPPATSVSIALQNASTVATQAQQQAKEIVAALSRETHAMKLSDANYAGGVASAEAAALGQLNQLIEQMTASFEAVQPADPGTAPVKGTAGGGTGAGGAAGTGAGSGTAARAVSAPGTGAAGAAGTTAADGSAAGAGGLDGSAAGAAAGVDPAAAAAVGPTSGAMAGWVQDPNSGTLTDPATGREVNAAGQFLDPVTGQPFGNSSAQNLSRLEGLQGGVGTTGGLFGGAGVGAFTAPSGGVAGVTGGGGGGFAGLYGGVIPPSLMGSNPAMGQLAAKANQNLQAKAAVAQRYSALMTGQEQARPYMPPMGGAGGGMAGGGRSGRPSRRLVSEPSNVWGATGRGNRDGRQRTSTGATELVEDADVWTGGEQAGSGLLGP